MNYVKFYKNLPKVHRNLSTNVALKYDQYTGRVVLAVLSASERAKFVVAGITECCRSAALSGDTAIKWPRPQWLLQGGARMIYSVIEHPHHEIQTIRTGLHITPTMQKKNARTHSLSLFSDVSARISQQAWVRSGTPGNSRDCLCSVAVSLSSQRCGKPPRCSRESSSSYSLSSSKKPMAKAVLQRHQTFLSVSFFFRQATFIAEE